MNTFSCRSNITIHLMTSGKLYSYAQLYAVVRRYFEFTTKTEFKLIFVVARKNLYDKTNNGTILAILEPQINSKMKLNHNRPIFYPL